MFIVTPIQERSQKKALQRIKTLYGKVDGAEIWLDHIEDLDLETLFNDSKKIPSFFSPRLTRRGLKKRLQILICCKKPIEKGHFKGTYSQLASLLIRAGQLGADYIDIPFNMPKNLIKKIVQHHAKSAFNAKGDHGIIELRKHLCWYFRGFPGANDLRKKFVQVETIDDIKKVLMEL